MRVSAVLSVLRAISSPEIIATPSGPLLLSPSPNTPSSLSLSLHLPLADFLAAILLASCWRLAGVYLAGCHGAAGDRVLRLGDVDAAVISAQVCNKVCVELVENVRPEGQSRNACFPRYLPAPACLLQPVCSSLPALVCICLLQSVCSSLPARKCLLHGIQACKAVRSSCFHPCVAFRV